MYGSLNEFLQGFGGSHSLLWSLLVIGVVASCSLLLFGFWEAVIRILYRGPGTNKRL